MVLEKCLLRQHYKKIDGYFNLQLSQLHLSAPGTEWMYRICRMHRISSKY